MRSRAPLFLLIALAAIFFYVRSQSARQPGADGSRAGVPASGAAARAPDGGALRAIKVALLLTGPISDDGWNASAFEGLERARAAGCETSSLESLEKSRFEEVFRRYAADGYDLILGHAYEFQDAALRVAPDYPKATFVVVAGNRAEGNVSSVSFRLEEATFALGALSAWMSRTGVVGLVGGEEIPSLKPGFDAFAAGARFARPDVRVITKYVGNWVDVTLGKEHASALIHQGADFIFQNADKAGLGVFDAVEENPGTFAFGSNKNQNAIAPKAILASAVIDVPEAIARAAAAVREGRFAPGAYGLGVREGIVSIAMNPELAAVVPDSTRARFDALARRVAAGEIDVFAPQNAPPPASHVPPPDWLRQ
jgi:basic membrane lipoprotein Med (substrate-binding protein (PBP1-ABC) superfamily)